MPLDPDKLRLLPPPLNLEDKEPDKYTIIIHSIDVKAIDDQFRIIDPNNPNNDLILLIVTYLPIIKNTKHAPQAISEVRIATDGEWWWQILVNQGNKWIMTADGFVRDDGLTDAKIITPKIVKRVMFNISGSETMACRYPPYKVPILAAINAI